MTGILAVPGIREQHCRPIKGTVFLQAGIVQVRPPARWGQGWYSMSDLPRDLALEKKCPLAGTVSMC